MTDTVTVSREELTATEVLDIVDDGKRVRIEVEALGTSIAVTLRKSNGQYYCDTQTKLLTHETPEAFRDCLETQDLVCPAGTGGTQAVTA